MFTLRFLFWTWTKQRKKLEPNLLDPQPGNMAEVQKRNTQVYVQVLTVKKSSQITKSTKNFRVY